MADRGVQIIDDVCGAFWYGASALAACNELELRECGRSMAIDMMAFRYCALCAMGLFWPRVGGVGGVRVWCVCGGGGEWLLSTSTQHKLCLL